MCMDGYYLAVRLDKEPGVQSRHGQDKQLL